MRTVPFGGLFMVPFRGSLWPLPVCFEEPLTRAGWFLCSYFWAWYLFWGHSMFQHWSVGPRRQYMVVIHLVQLFSLFPGAHFRAENNCRPIIKHKTTNNSPNDAKIFFSIEKKNCICWSVDPHRSFCGPPQILPVNLRGVRNRVDNSRMSSRT